MDHLMEANELERSSNGSHRRQYWAKAEFLHGGLTFISFSASAAAASLALALAAAATAASPGEDGDTLS